VKRHRLSSCGLGGICPSGVVLYCVSQYHKIFQLLVSFSFAILVMGHA
jgi:hypothetical protein